MVRGAARSGSGRAVLNELHPNSEPPQSTFAAQLVHRITNGERQHRNQDEDTFKLLIKEVLESENEPSTTANASETNLEVNYKLIYVIVKAGLDALAQDNPFVQYDVLVRQAIESLTAIDITLRRTPSVLFVSPSLNESSQRDIPLVLWLVPRVISFFAIEDSEGLDKASEKLLTNALSLEEKLHLRGVKHGSLLRYLQGCVSGQSSLFDE